ncbi:DUF6531 domain-containing protein [Kitasatospora sp. NBC_01250]|uniref:DUF6531 domain-containing protein n=1 Tax=Kitasatospora sp. NBC_01250 TaxID=2903571 RepID=UPI002E37D206|nr:RHS repeat-associated core domain-containing protein [Kitasatospora sp. NBC_01250]
MSNRIVQALEDGARRLGKTLAEDAGKTVKDLYHSAGTKLKTVAKRTAEADAEHESALKKIMGDAEHDEPHLPGGSGDRSKPGDEGAGRRQAADPREAGRTEDAVCPGGEPVDMATGRMFIDQVDASLPGSLPLLFTRTFESGYRAGRWMGRRWVCTFDERLEIDAEGVVHLGADRRTQAYPHPGPGDPVRASAGERRDLALAPGGYTLTDRATGLVREFTLEPGGTEALLTRVRDRSGRHYDLAYDEHGTPHSITHSGGYRLLVTVDNDRITALRLAGAGPDGHDALLLRYGYTDGHLTSVYNSSGRPMRFANDAGGRILSWTDRNDSQYCYVYDHLDRVIDEGGADGSLKFRFTYGDPDPVTGLRTHTETNALGHTTTYTVNEHAQITAVTDPLGHTTHDERDEYDRLLARTDPLGRTTRYAYDGAGDLITVTRPDGERTTARYADCGALPTEVVEPGGATWQQSYDESGRRIALVDPLGATTAYGYDEHGHLSTVTDALGGVTRVVCDAAGLLVRITDPSGATNGYQRDAFGRIVAHTDPLGAVTRLSWTIEGYPASRTTPDGACETWTYDGEGNLLAHVDQLGQVTGYEYGHFETLAARTDPDGARYAFEHDAHMQLTGVTNALGLRWTYSYDAAGRLVGERDFNGRTVRYGLDAAGQLGTLVNPLGQQLRYERDRLGRTVSLDAAGRTTRYSYDPGGHLIGATGPGVELVRTVDAVGNVRTETVNGRTLVSDRDPLGRVVRRTTPAGHVSTWSYDAAGRPTALTTPGGSFDFAHDRAGRETRRVIGGRLTLTSSWDSRNRLIGRVLGTPDTVLGRHDYVYRADDGLIGLDDLLGGPREFVLDAVGRVTAVRAAGWTENYSYDPAGNLTAADWPASSAGRAALGARSYAGTRLVSAGRVGYAYDAARRMTLRQVARQSREPDTWRYTWDAQDRLTGVTTPDGACWQYLYDPLGRRIAKQRLDGSAVVERTEFTWDGSTLAEQTTHAPYLPGPHTLSWDHDGLHPLAQTETIAAPGRSERRFFAIVTDLVGTPVELVDTATDSVAWRATATLWGATSWPAGSATYTPLRFPGQYFDPETRLHYNHHRYYDPETARYVSPDPLGLAPAQNYEAYVHNPHTWTDHLGLSPHRGSSRSRAPETPKAADPVTIRHFTSEDSYKKIMSGGSKESILLKASSPDKGHPRGVYVTPMSPAEILAKKGGFKSFLGITNEKSQYLIEFQVPADQFPGRIRGGRSHVWFSPDDIRIPKGSITYHGPTSGWSG